MEVLNTADLAILSAINKSLPKCEHDEDIETWLTSLTRAVNRFGFNIAGECPHPKPDATRTKGFQMSNSILESCMVAPRAVALFKTYEGGAYQDAIHSLLVILKAELRSASSLAQMYGLYDEDKIARSGQFNYNENTDVGKTSDNFANII